MKSPSLLLRILIWLIPALLALGAFLGLAPWMLGIPGDANAPYAEGWWLGLLSLVGYLIAYAIFAIVWILARLIRVAPIAYFAHGFVWLCAMTFAIMQYLAWVQILEA